MTAKSTVQAVNDGAMFLITKVDHNGKETVTTENSVETLDHKGIAQFLNQSFKGEGTRRAAHQSFLSNVFSNPKLDGYKGKGDKTTGKTSKEFKASIRACEDMVFAELQSEGLLKLPKSDNPEKTFQEFCTSIREDKNYSNIKSTVSKYYAFVGANCVTVSGFLVPHAVMLAQIKSVMDVEKPDGSIAGQLRAIRAELDKITISADDTNDSLIVLKDIQDLLTSLKNHHAEIATNAPAQATIKRLESHIPQAQAKTQAKSVPTIAEQAIATAKGMQELAKV